MGNVPNIYQKLTNVYFATVVSEFVWNISVQQSTNTVSELEEGKLNVIVFDF